MHDLEDSNQTDSVFSALEVNETSAFTIAHLPGEAQAVLLFQKTSANYTHSMARNFLFCDLKKKKKECRWRMVMFTEFCVV